MTEILLMTATIALLAWATGLVALTFALKVASRRAERRRAATERRWRGPLEELVLGGRTPRAPIGAERPVVRDMLLKYLSVLRGGEAAAIGDYLETSGFVDEAIERLGSRRGWDRAEAADLLGRVRSPKGVDALVATLDDANEDVRTVAARSLAAIHDPATVGALASTLGRPSRWTVSMVSEDLVEMGAEAVPALLDMLRADEHATVTAAVKILGEIRDPRATLAVTQLLRGSTDLNVRAQAAAALGKLGGAEARSALEMALRDPAWQVRSQAAKALGHAGGPGTAARLAHAIFDDNWWVRVNCAEALARLGDQGRDELLRLLDAPDRFVREQCLGVAQEHGLVIPARAAAPPVSSESGPA